MYKTVPEKSQKQLSRKNPEKYFVPTKIGVSVLLGVYIDKKISSRCHSAYFLADSTHLSLLTSKPKPINRRICTLVKIIKKSCDFFIGFCV